MNELHTKNFSSSWQANKFLFSLLSFSILCFLQSSCSTQKAVSDSGTKNIPESNYYKTSPDIDTSLRNFEKLNFEEKKSVFEGLRLSFADTETKQKAAYALARLKQKSGNIEEIKQSIPLFEDASQLPYLKELCQLHISECANILGNEKLVRKNLKFLIENTKDDIQAQAIYGLAQSYLRASEFDLAFEEFKKVLKVSPSSQYALGSQYYLGLHALKQEDLDSCLKYWRNYLENSPDGRFGKEIVQAWQSNEKLIQTQADHILFANVFFAHGNWQKALSEWTLSNSNKSWYKKSICLFRLGKTNEATKSLLSGIKSDPNNPDVIDAAKLLAKLSSKEDASKIWQLIKTNCPKYTDIALYNLAIRAPERISLTIYNELVTRFPHSDYAAESAWWIVLSKIKAGKAKEALYDLNKGSKLYSSTKSGPRFEFWQGKIQEKLGQKQAAIDSYKRTIQKFGSNYYAWRAKGRLISLNSNGKSKDPAWSIDTRNDLRFYNKFHQGITSWDWPMPPDLVSYSQIAKDTNQTIACLAELHVWDECLDCLSSYKLPELKSLCLAKLKLSLEAINTISKDLTNHSPNHSLKWQLAYPLLYANIIGFESNIKHIDPFLAQGLIREESRYNVYALSSSNAIGLMQLLPSTASGLAKKLHLNIVSTDEIHQPENNLKLGIDYLSYTLARFNGKAMLAVASYNGGPNAVARWMKERASLDPDLFVECIPFTETRDYVRKVFSSYWNYRFIYTH